FERYQAAVRDLVGVGGLAPVRDAAAGPLRIVDVDRVGAAGDGVLEVAAGDQVVQGQGVLALDPAGLADSDLCRRVDQDAVVEARHVLPQEGVDLQHLPTAFDLGAG